MPTTSGWNALNGYLPSLIWLFMLINMAESIGRDVGFNICARLLRFVV